MSGGSSKESSAAFEIEQDLLPDLALTDSKRADNAFLVGSAVDDATLRWLNKKADGEFCKLIGNGIVFSLYEVQRKLTLMFVLNVLTTLTVGYYNRNSAVKKTLEDFD